jgi:SAM-dependent methyltransferase
MARWTRAAGWLPAETRRLLDVGCAFGFGTERLRRVLERRAAGGGPAPLVVGVEYTAEYARQAGRRYPGLAIVRGSAEALPFPDDSFDALTMLDVLEHLPDPRRALAEVARVLRPGGTLLLTVPHGGALAGLDSLNLYEALRTWLPGFPPLDPSERGYPRHRHFRLAELGGLLGADWRLERVAGTGTGLAEPLNLVLLLVCRGLLRWEASYRWLRFGYYSLILADDLLPTGRFGYNLAVRVRYKPAV